MPAGDRLAQLEHVLGHKVAENNQLHQRCVELESLVQEQLCQSQQQANVATRLQAQIVLLEERLRISTDCTNKLQADNEQLRSTNEQLQRQATILQQHLAAAAACLPAAASIAGSAEQAASASGALAALAAAPAAARAAADDCTPSTAAGAPSMSPSAAQSGCNGLSSAFAALATAAADEEDSGFELAAANSSTAGAVCSSSGLSGSSTPIPLPISAIGRAHSLSHTPLSSDHTRGGLSMAASASQLAASSPSVGLLGSVQELSPHPSQVGDLVSSVAAPARAFACWHAQVLVLHRVLACVGGLQFAVNYGLQCKYSKTTAAGAHHVMSLLFFFRCRCQASVTPYQPTCSTCTSS